MCIFQVGFDDCAMIWVLIPTLNALKEGEMGWCGNGMTRNDGNGFEICRCSVDRPWFE